MACVTGTGVWWYSLFFWKSCDSSSAITRTDFSCRQVRSANVRPTAQIVFPLSGHLVRDFRCVCCSCSCCCCCQYSAIVVFCMDAVPVPVPDPDPVSVVAIAVVVNKSCMAVILLCLRCVVPNARTSRHLCSKLQFDPSVKETPVQKSPECCSGNMQFMCLHSFFLFLLFNTFLTWRQ